MLEAMIRVKRKIDIEQYSELQCLLKLKSKDFNLKKAQAGMFSNQQGAGLMG